MLEEVLDSGAARDRFRRMLLGQGVQVSYFALGYPQRRSRLSYLPIFSIYEKNSKKKLCT